MDPQTVAELLGTWGYPALFLLLLLTGVGAPIPEDLLLLAAGYLVFAGLFHWPVAFVICTAGVVSSDLLLYSAGRHVARRSAAAAFRLLPPRRLERATRWFGRLGNRIILVARFVPGTRVLVFVSAGVRAVPLSSFLRYDVIGAALWVPAMLAVGHAAGDRVGDVGDLLRSLHQRAFWALLLLLILVAMWIAWGREESKL